LRIQSLTVHENGSGPGKKVKGRKRHLVVDTLGLLLAVTVTAASVQDRDAAAPVVAQHLYNDAPKPFVWTKTADQILNSIARFCKRISDSGH